MKRLLTLVALIGLSIQAFSSEECERAFPDDGARKIAISFLSRQESKNEYEGYPVSTVERECDWLVSFKRKNGSEGSTGKVIIHKTTGTAKWLSEN